jgi:hypothetical protein
MNKANNRFAFYMLMFCSVGTLGNLVLLNVVRFAPIDLHGMSYERSEGSKKY